MEVAIPSKGVIDVPAAQATKKLRNENLQVRSEEVSSNGVKPGNVVDTEPAPGEKVECESAVTILISKGVKLSTVPDVVGLQQSEADTALRDAGLIPNFEEEDSDLPEGQVIGQNPAGGSEVKKDTEVTVRVSNGEGTVTVPNVEGQPEDTAVNQLKKPRRDEHPGHRAGDRGRVARRARDLTGPIGRVADPRVGPGDDLRGRVRRARGPGGGSRRRPRRRPRPGTPPGARHRAWHQSRGAAPVKVAVISGGRSSEHDVSIRSGESVAAGLEEAGHEVIRVLIERDGRWLVDGSEVELRAAGGLLGADVAFPVLHGPFGEDGTVQGLLECLDVPYAGPSVLAAAVAMDKLICKRLLAHHGFPQVNFCQVGEPGWREQAAAMGMPIWVKPSRLGSSVGITRVMSAEQELDDAVELALRHDPRVIVEAHCEAREVECSVIGNTEPEASLPGEIVTQGHEWYDFEAKYTDGGMQLAVPAPIGDEAVERVRELAVEVYKALDCRGLARCDFFVTEGGEVLVNEINTIPGFTETSVFGKLFEATGVPYPELCDRLVKLAVERHADGALIRVLSAPWRTVPIVVGAVTLERPPQMRCIARM